MVIVWTAPLTDHIASGVTAEKDIARYRYYPIHADIAQFPITQYWYRSNPTENTNRAPTLRTNCGWRNSVPDTPTITEQQ